MIFGHIDHLPILGRKYVSFEGWKRDPFTPSVEGDWIYGKGCQDEKGGLCAMITAAKALITSGFQPKGDIYFVAVQGHKRISSGILHLLKTGFTADYAINTENSGNAVVPLWVGRAEGSMRVRIPAVPELHFHTKEKMPNLKSRKSAFEQVRRLLDALGPEMVPPGPDSWMTHSVTPGLEDYPQMRMETITFHAMSDLEISFQIRTVPGQTDDTIRTDLERVMRELKATDPEFQAEIRWPSWLTRPAGNTPVSDPLVQACVRAHTYVAGAAPDLGPKGRIGAAADASHVVGQLHIPTILYGPGGGDSDLEHEAAALAHEVEPDERIRIDDIVIAAKVYALTAAQLSG
jgi:acetylornithine deacetylase/succinyl-diaminopimelate desuccinylase-like protein